MKQDIAKQLVKYSQAEHGIIEFNPRVYFIAAIAMYAFTFVMVLVWLLIGALTQFDFNPGFIGGTIFIGAVVVGLAIGSTVILYKGLIRKRILANKDKLLVTDATIVKAISQFVYVNSESQFRDFSPVIVEATADSVRVEMRQVNKKKTYKTTYEYIDEHGKKRRHTKTAIMSLGGNGETLQIFTLGKFSYPFLMLQFEPLSLSGGQAHNMPELRTGKNETRCFDELRQVLRRDYFAIKRSHDEVYALLVRANHGDTRAQKNMACMHIFGDDVPQSDKVAIEWLTFMCEQNNHWGWSIFRLFSLYSYCEKVKRAFQKVSSRRSEIEAAVLAERSS